MCITAREGSTSFYERQSLVLQLQQLHDLSFIQSRPISFQNTSPIHIPPPPQQPAHPSTNHPAPHHPTPSFQPPSIYFPTNLISIHPLLPLSLKINLPSPHTTSITYDSTTSNTVSHNGQADHDRNAAAYGSASPPSEALRVLGAELGLRRRGRGLGGGGGGGGGWASL